MKVSEDIKKKMKVIKSMLEENGLLNDADLVNLELLEQEFVIYEMCNKDIETHGVTIQDARGSLKTNPAASMRNKSANTIMLLLRDFGISARARKNLLKNTADVEDVETPLTSYMKSISIR